MRKKSSSRNPSIPYGSVIESFQNEIKQIVLNYQIKKCNIFNMDETGIFLDTGDPLTRGLLTRGLLIEFLNKILSIIK